MVFLGNLILLIFALFIIAIQIAKYNQIIFDRYRFRYFSLRDKLAMLVVNNKIEEDSWEYQNIIDTINFHITTIENVCIKNIITLLANYHTSPEEEMKVRLIKRKLDHPEVIEIMAEFMDVTASLLERNSRMQIKLLKFLAEHSGTKHRDDMKPISRHKLALDKVSYYRDELRRSLGNEKLAIA